MDTWMGRSQEPVTLHKYLYANEDPAVYTDPTGNFSIGSLMTSVSKIATLVETSQIAIDVFSSVTSGESVSATQVGMVSLASLGGIKLFKAIGRKFLNKFNCGKPNEKKICKIFMSDEERIHKLRTSLRIGKKKNIAFVDYLTTDGIGSIVSASGEHAHPGTVGMPGERKYQTGFVGSHKRAFDSEVKLYENMAIRFNTKTMGIARLVSELPICRSCNRVGRLFKRDHPRLFLLTKGGVTGRSKGR